MAPRIHVGCAYCGITTMQQTTQKILAAERDVDVDTKYATCGNCGLHFCCRCIRNMFSKILHEPKLTPHQIFLDPSLVALRSMSAASTNYDHSGPTMITVVWSLLLPVVAFHMALIILSKPQLQTHHGHQMITQGKGSKVQLTLMMKATRSSSLPVEMSPYLHLGVALID